MPFLGTSQLYTPGAGVTDIDGNTYQTIIINGQEWMAENLRTTKYANGDPIPNVTDANQWSNLTTGAWVHYNNDSQYENSYGKLYNWHAVDDSRNVCPTGWHVPSDNEWSTFINYLDPNADGGNVNNIAGGKMKNTGIQYWQSPNVDATNESGFLGLPGGARRSDNGVFVSIGNSCSWWSSTEYDDKEPFNAWHRSLGYLLGSAGRYRSNKNFGFSIRCIKNSISGINEINPLPKNLIKIVNIMGEETTMNPYELLFFIYSDGSVEKKIVIEK